MDSESSVTVSDALALATFSEPRWNATGSAVGYLRDQDGDSAFVARPVDTVTETTLSPNAGPLADGDSRSNASCFAWHPTDEHTVAVVSDGDLGLVDVDSGDWTLLTAATSAVTSIAWHPDGDVIASVREGSVWLHDVRSGSHRELTAAAADMFGPTPLKWSTDGRFLATLTDSARDTLSLQVFSPTVEPAATPGDRAAADPVVYEHTPAPTEQVITDTFAWAGSTLVVATDATDGTERAYRVVDVASGASTDRDPDARTVLTEQDPRGLPSASIVGHPTGRVAIVSATSGYAHLYVCDLAELQDGPEPLGDAVAGVTQVTTGAFEARGDSGDTPAWNEAGTQLAYVTNEHDAGERRLHVAAFSAPGADEPCSLIDARATVFDDVDGNALAPSWRDGRIACLRAGRTTPADVHVCEPSTRGVRRVSASHPNPAVFDGFPAPEPVRFESSRDGRPVYGYRYSAPDTGPQDDADQPAVVWAHGGPLRQMRRGFHHMRSYALFHAFNQVLVARGYTVLELNYRGGIGYGRDYELGIHDAIGEIDVQDCVDAAAYLRDRPGVSDQIGFWGLSYGGFLANALATKTDAYDCVVNFAGIWDWRDWVRYVTNRTWSAGRHFLPLFGGHPDDADASVTETYRVASPCDHVTDCETPLFALHGTEDPNVPFAQLDALVTDLVDQGVDFEMAYYPEEGHVFERTATWEDALDRVLPFLDTNLQ